MAYCIPKDFELELSDLDIWINNPPGWLGVYEEAFEAKLRFSLSPFILEFLRSYGVPLCILTPNSIKHIVGFLIVYFLAEVQPTFSLFHAFFTAKKHPYSKDWWYLTIQKGVGPLIKDATFAIKRWKERFLFVSCSSVDDWGQPSWGWLEVLALSFPSLSAKEESHFRILGGYKVHRLKHLLFEETLCSMGLSWLPSDEFRALLCSLHHVSHFPLFWSNDIICRYDAGEVGGIKEDHDLEEKKGQDLFLHFKEGQIHQTWDVGGPLWASSCYD